MSRDNNEIKKKAEEINSREIEATLEDASDEIKAESKEAHELGDSEKE